MTDLLFSLGNSGGLAGCFLNGKFRCDALTVDLIFPSKSSTQNITENFTDWLTY